MAHLLDQRSATGLLRDHGWSVDRGGKHVVKMVKDGQRPITLPHNHRRPYGKGLTSAIIRQAGIDQAEAKQWISLSSHAKREMATGRRSGSSRAASRQLEL